ncbi:MAG TPA: glutamine amidotransferase [Streptosporangiaceae bacterium]|nr:glutamine amidotransferase [Streptosporangiaceae bacterium]
MTLAPITVRICYLYPRLLSVAGDRGNLFALMQRCAWRGIGCSVTEADAGEVPDFSQSDLILVHGGQDREMTAAAQDLASKAGPLREAIESDAVVLAVCAGYQLLGQSYTPPAGPPLQGLGVLDVITYGGPKRFIGHVAAECELNGRRHHLAGFENHSGRTYLEGNARPLGRLLAGSGNNGEDGTEGARYREVYATYLHGPVLPKNPWLADHLLSRALAHRYQDFGPLAPLTDHTERQAQAAALRLARRPARRWRAAAAAVSRMRRPVRVPALAGREAGVAADPIADKESGWTSP